jgi:hypothetical protein
MDLHDGAFGAVETTISRIQELISIASNFYARAVEYELRVRLAFETSSTDPLKGFQAPQDALAPLRLTARGRLALAALELGDRLLRGSDVEVRNALASVNELRPALQNRCDQDFVYATVAAALVRMNAREEARNTVREYLTTSRRERGHVLRSLALIAGDLGVHDSLPCENFA